MRTTSWSTRLLGQTSPWEWAGLNRARGQLALGLMALLASVPLAFFIERVNTTYPTEAERATQIVGIVFVGLVLSSAAVYLGIRRRAATVSELALVVLATVCVLLVANYLYVVSFEIFFPADIFIWSETDFVNDILKFRVGYPIFSPQINNESFTYPPGSQLLTYLLAWISGHPTSIPAYRVIQFTYTLLAAVVALGCCRQLLEVCAPRRLKNEFLFGLVFLPLLFLFATNSLTNPFTHLLHNDALTQLITVAAYWLLLRYAITGNKHLLWLMAIIPTAGFWVKQSLAVWALIYCVQLAVIDQPRSLKRLLLFGLSTFSGIGISMAAGYALWGGDFTYWIFTVLGKHGVSPLRSFQHMLTIWPYFVIGLLSGALLLRGEKFKVLFGPWLIWLVLISLETYTSGIAWMLNHIGPGCLIAGIWFLAAFAVVWPEFSDATGRNFHAQNWLRVGVALAVFCLLFSGLAIIRAPVRPIGQDAHRYVSDVEREFEGQVTEDVLIDLGTWVYMRDGVVMKDRAPSIGERGYSQIGDFSGIIQRLTEKRYAKILVRNLHSPDFWYDYQKWRKSSGIRQAMMDNYRETGTIKPVAVHGFYQLPYGFSEISILVPRKE